MTIRCTTHVSHFTKDMTVPRSTIELDLPPGLGERDFAQHVFWWSQNLQDQFRVADLNWTVAIVNDQVRVLSDQEASQHNIKRFKQYIGRLITRHELTTAVDRTNLGEHQRRVHERSLLRQGAIMANIEKARDPLKPTAAAHPGVSLRRYREDGRAQANPSGTDRPDPPHPA